MFKWFRKWIYNIFKEKETGAELNNIRREKQAKHEDLLK